MAIAIRFMADLPFSTFRFAGKRFIPWRIVLNPISLANLRTPPNSPQLPIPNIVGYLLADLTHKIFTPFYELSKSND